MSKVYRVELLLDAGWFQAIARMHGVHGEYVEDGETFSWLSSVAYESESAALAAHAAESDLLESAYEFGPLDGSE